VSTWVDQLLGLKKLSTGTADVALRLAHPVPGWAWVLAGLAAAGLAGWTYWRLLGGRGARTALATLRTLTLLLILLLIAGPQLVKETERVEPDWVVVMVDRSASMTVADAAGPGGQSRPREAELEDALSAARPTLDSLAKKRNVLFLGFDSSVFDLPNAAANLAPPEGRRTLLGQSLEAALRRVAGRPVAGVVVFSDGRSGDAPSRALLRQIESRQVPVFGVPLGSPTPLADLAVARVEAPSAGFVGDAVPVSVRVERLGQGDWPGGKLELVDDVTGQVLEARPLSAVAEDSQSISLIVRPDRPQEARWTVRLALDKDDLSAGNNRAPVRVEIVDRAIRVLYLDGYPRWEYRYLKNLLVRESSIRSTAMLLASERRSIQEGSEPLGTLPRTREQWSGIDVVMVGDLRPGLLSDDQQAQLKWLIAERGAGLLWIGGEAATPGAWRNTVLSDLLPFSLSESGEQGLAAWPQDVVMRPGPAAERYGVLRLSEDEESAWPNELSEPSLGWPRLRWAQRIEPLWVKPAAEVLAVATPSDQPTAEQCPILLTMRFGAGRVVYVGTDETWRYRYGRGEVLQERLWLPLIRLLARESLSRSGKPAILAASPGRAQVDQPVQISVRLVDQSLVDQRPATLSVRVSRAGGSADVTLRPEAPPDEDALPNVFSATWTPQEPGTYTLQPTDALLSSLDLAARVEISLPDDELRVPQTDHPLLASLAQATGGRMLTPGTLSDLPGLLPNRELRLLGTPEIETLWDKPLVWILLMVLLGAEWAGRRLIKLS